MRCISDTFAYSINVAFVLLSLEIMFRTLNYSANANIVLSFVCIS